MMVAQQLRPTLVTFAALVEAGVVTSAGTPEAGIPVAQHRFYALQACGHGLFWDRALVLLEVRILVQMQR